MDISVMFPSHARPEKLGRCVAHLADQTLAPGRYEVVIGLDGPDPESESAARAAWADARRPKDNLRVVTFPREGHIPVQRALLPTLRGRIYVSLNDDVLPEPGFLEAHLAGHEMDPSGVQIVGHSPFLTPQTPTLFDLAADRTPLIFFYPLMNNDNPRHDWGYRCAFGLNCSMPIHDVRHVGGLPHVPRTYGHEDIELAWRLSRMRGLPVMYRPDARAPHDHRYRPGDVLRREYNLGVASRRYREINPAFTFDLFGRDIISERELDYARAYIEHERSTCVHIEREFLGLDQIPLDAIDPGHRDRMARVAYQQFFLLKRFIWRQGLLDEHDGIRDGYRQLTVDTEAQTAAA